MRIFKMLIFLCSALVGLAWVQAQWGLTDTNIALVGLALVSLVLFLWVRPARRARRPRGNWIMVDGSNVLHWKDATPQIATVRAVVAELKSRGFDPAVVFDANAGYKIAGRYQNDRNLAQAINLPDAQVYVVPKGTQADPYLLALARDLGARVVTNDRFRDWVDLAPEIKEPGFLVRGGYRSGALWLEEGVALMPEITAISSGRSSV